MTTTHLFGFDGRPSAGFSDGPWRAFTDRLADAGYPLAQPGHTRASSRDLVVCLNHSSEAMILASAQSIPLEHRVLVAMEPFVVRPDQYRRNVLDHYGQRWAPSPLWAQRLSGHHFPYPAGQDVSATAAIRSRQQRLPKAIMIQGNKASLLKGSNYALRREVAVRGADLIDLTGAGWPATWAGDARSLFGALHTARSAIPSVAPALLIRHLRFRPDVQIPAPADKWEAASHYEVAVVIENSRDFVSEKFFDAVLAGCTIVYVGPSLRAFGIDPACAAEVPPRAAAIVEAVSGLVKDGRLRTSQREAQTALISGSWSRWEATGVLSSLADSIARSA